jgi:hypothetical protein
VATRVDESCASLRELGKYLELRNAFDLRGGGSDSSFRVLLLADDQHPGNVVRDHIKGFVEHSQHDIRVVNPIHAPADSETVWHDANAVLTHYSIFVLGEYFLPPEYLKRLVRFPGPKLQIIQDEQRHIDRMKARQAEIDFAAVFSSLSPENLAKVYHREASNETRYFSCLPGYVPEYAHKLDTVPLAERPLDIVYRGRHLPYWLGRAGQEKRAIGEQVLGLARANGLKVDIDWTEDSRIYGSAWIDFLSSGRCTLGVEGGSSIFDFDDSITDAVHAYLEERPDAPFDEVFDRILAPYEGNVVHRTMTPKLLEAIATRTALILYPGAYRGILEPGRHYIPLEPDGSNVREVLERVRDLKYLEDLVEFAHSDILPRPELASAYYVRAIDAVIAHLCHCRKTGLGQWVRWEGWLAKTERRLKPGPVARGLVARVGNRPR